MTSVHDFTAALEAAMASCSSGPGTSNRIELNGLEWVDGDSMDTLVLDIVYRDMSAQTRRARVADLDGLLSSLNGNVESLAALLVDDIYEQHFSGPL
jgi:hypothetical protein